MDGRAGRALPAAARRHAQPGQDQRLLPRRRSWRAQRALPAGRGARRHRHLRFPGDRAGHRVRLLHVGDAQAQRQGAVGARPYAHRRRRRLRGQYRVAEAILGRRRRQFPHPRHALQSRRGAAYAARRRRCVGRRPDAMPRRGHRRARAQIRRRHRHAPRLRRFRHRRQPRGQALLRRGRGHMAQALCDLGTAGGAAAGADGAFDHRRQIAAAVHAVDLSRGRSGEHRGTRGEALARPYFARKNRRRFQRRRAPRHIRPHRARRLQN